MESETANDDDEGSCGTNRWGEPRRRCLKRGGSGEDAAVADVEGDGSVESETANRQEDDGGHNPTNVALTEN